MDPMQQRNDPKVRREKRRSFQFVFVYAPVCGCLYDLFYTYMDCFYQWIGKRILYVSSTKRKSPLSSSLSASPMLVERRHSAIEIRVLVPIYNVDR
jgi:hypothetical protein